MMMMNTLALRTSLYGSEYWIIKASYETRKTAAEMKYMRRTAAGCTWDRSQNKYRDCEGIKYNPNSGQNTR
jgi:hypothetical protein